MYSIIQSKNMDFLKKESTSQTTESFNFRTPLAEKALQNVPYASQIQELMANLVQKRADLKEAKLKQSNLLGKEQQQEVRISKIRIGLQHQIQKEHITRNQQDRLQEQMISCKESIKDLTKCVKTVKLELSEVLQDIISSKKNKVELQSICSQLECLIQGKTCENTKIDQQIQNLQSLILASQNDVRTKHEQLTNLQLQKSQFCSLVAYLEERIKLGNRAKNNAICQNTELSQQIVKTQQKIHNIKKESNEIEWSCERIRSQNTQILDLNQRLSSDLESVKKHLAAMQKMNQLLQNSLNQYGVTGDKVTKLITSVRNQSEK